MIVLGFSQGMQPIVAYNYGAKNYKRMWDTFYLTVKCALTITLVGCLICELFPLQITRLFASGDSAMDTKLVQITIDGFRKNMCFFWAVGIAVIGTNFFASMGKPKKALFLSLTRQIIFLIPLLLFLPNLWGADGVWFATPMADVLSVSCTIYLVWRERRLQSNLIGNY